MVMNLVREFSLECEEIDLLVIRARGPHFDDIPANVRLVKLQARHTLTAIPELVRYFRRERPAAMLVAKDRAARAALIARKIAKVPTRIVVRLGTNLSTALKHRSGISAWWRTAPMRKIYASVDKVVAVSEGVREDTLKITGLPPERVCVVRNPVITEAFYKQAEALSPHAWMRETDVPVIMGIGRLSVQKDFETLIKAFRLVKNQTNARLLILGDGSLRYSLEELVEKLELGDCVLLPGFQKNPNAWLARASVFVLSSRWEGSPNALTEALALGIPSVSTLCPSGPDELLQNGKYGVLVNMGDVEAMARAIIETMERPLPADFIKESVVEYSAHTSAGHYLRLLKGLTSLQTKTQSVEEN